MKTRTIVLLSFALIFPNSFWAQNTWEFSGGPWHSLESADIANEQGIMYAIRSVSNTLTKSTDSGETWIHLSTPNVTTNALLSIACEQENTDMIYLGLATCNNNRCGEVYKTSNGGATWARVLVTANSAPVEIAISPHDQQLVYVGTASGSTGERTGLHYTTDGGATWGNYHNQNFPSNSQVSGIVFDPANSQNRFVSIVLPSNIAAIT